MTLFENHTTESRVYTLRDYQQEASDAAVRFFNSHKKSGIIVLPTGSGKSLVLADIVNRLDGNVVILQHSKEILEQNHEKFMSYDPFADVSIFSASFNSKKIAKVTYATIGSVCRSMQLFNHFDYILVDECVPYDQKISTENGSTRIGTLYNMYKKGEELPKVLSYDESNDKMVESKISSVWCSGEKETITIDMSMRRHLRITRNHPLWTNKGWVKAGDLKVGDVVFNSDNSAVAKIPNNDQLSIIIGGTLGDGNADPLRKNYGINRFRFIHGENQEEYLRWKASVLGASVEKVANNGYSKKTAYRCQTSCLSVADELTTMRGAIDSLTPMSLAVAWMDDGSMNKAGNQATLFSTAPSLEMTKYLMDKLHKMGIDSVIGKANSSSTKKPYYWLRFRKTELVKLSKLIAKYIHPSMAYKIIEEHRCMAGEYEWNNEYEWKGGSVVQGISKGRIEKVYNMEVEKTNTYTLCTSNHIKDKKGYGRGIIAHNCHLVSAKSGMYKTFFNYLKGRQILGVTASPFRPATNSFGTELRFLTRTRPRVFDEVLYYSQIKNLKNQGYMADMKYYSLGDEFDTSELTVNSTRMDYTDESVRSYYNEIHFEKRIADVVERLLRAGRKNVLVFTKFIEESNAVKEILGSKARVVSAYTKKDEREESINMFKSGQLKVVLNCSALGIGFDYPELDTVLLAQPTRSLARYYQFAGRCCRPHDNKKDAWVVDMCGTYERFGKIEDLMLRTHGNGKWFYESNGKQLTNVYLD